MRAALQVHAFAGGVVAEHDTDDRIIVEGGGRGAAFLAGDAAVDDDDGLRIAGAGADLLGEVVE